jgi:DNA repair protein RecO (recombination protein O)
MSRETNYTAIILKKQPFGETDELITFYTQEAGKLRALAKGVKATTSKLAYVLQPLSVMRITTAGRGHLQKIIHATSIRLFRAVHSQTERVHAWYVAAELCLKATPDEQKNEELFALCLDFLEFLETTPPQPLVQACGSVKFKLLALTHLGLSPRLPLGEYVYVFSNHAGGFARPPAASDARPVSPETCRLSRVLFDMPFSKLPQVLADPTELQELLTSFISYQLERELKSEQVIEQIKNVIY